MTTRRGASTHLVRTVGLLALAIGLRICLRLWIGSGANGGLDRVMILCGGLLMLACTGLAAVQATLGMLALRRRG